MLVDKEKIVGNQYTIGFEVRQGSIAKQFSVL